MYSIILDQGIVFRNVDKVVIAPCDSAENADFKAYINWVNAGNRPTIWDSKPDFVPGTPA